MNVTANASNKSNSSIITITILNSLEAFTGRRRLDKLRSHARDSSNNRLGSSTTKHFPWQCCSRALENAGGMFNITL